MNYGGTFILSKGTVASGRGLFFLSISVVLAVKLKVDISSLQVLGVSLKETQINSAVIYVLAILWISHFVHWIGDLVSLGKWNSSMKSKLAESTHGGGGKMKGRLEYIVQEFERALDEEDKIHKSADIDYVAKAFKEINDSLWWHEKTAVFYVFGWYLVVPTILAVCAVCLIANG